MNWSIVSMSGCSGAASPADPFEGSGSAELQRIYDRVDALLPRVEDLAGDHARLEEITELSEAREKSLHARLLQAEASRMRWKTAYIQLPLLANPKIMELQENDSEDSRKCKALLDVDNAGPEMQLKKARRHVELSETNLGYEDIVKDLRAELTKLRQAYETLSTNKDKEATEAAQKLQQNIEELQLAARKKDDEIGRLRAEAFDAENKLKAMEKDNTALLRITEVEGAQATEAKHKLRKNIKELQVAARHKDDEIRRLRAKAHAVKNKLLVAEDKLDEIQKLKEGQLESLKRKRTSLPNARCDNMTPKVAVFQMRFAAKRLRRVIDTKMSAAKRAIIARSAFKELLNVLGFTAPMELIEFVVMNTNHKIREFRYEGKAIVFTRDMVKKVLGVPSGNRPLHVLKRSQQSELRSMYMNEKGRTTLARAIEILEKCDDTDEETVIQSFGLVAFGTVLCPGTGNTVRCEYLGSLMDMNAIDQYAIDEHILCEVMKEVEIFQTKMRRRPELDASQIHWIGQCLPMLAIIYMDFLSFPALAPDEHTINYGIPRICFVCDADFQLAVAIDKNKMSFSPSAFGNRPLLPLSSTLYAAVAPTNVPPSHSAPANEGDVEMSSEDVEVNPSASLNERLKSNQDLEVPAHLEGLYNKHKDLYTAEVDVALSTFGQVMKAVQAKRVEALLVDVHVASVASSSFTIPCPLSFAQPAAAVAPQDGQAKKQLAQADSPNKVQEDAAVENVVMEAGDKGLDSSCGQSSKDRAACNERRVSK